MIGKKGRYIVVEGLEGSGKTTAIRTIKKFLSANDIQYVAVREPGATNVGEVIRDLLKDPNAKDSMDARTELLLFYAARIELIQQIVNPSLEKGCWVISDRCELSSFAYQIGGRKLDETILKMLSGFCIQSLRPDLLIFLDINPEHGLWRAKKRGKLDRIEQESLDFFKDVSVAYHKYIKDYNHVAIIDASQPLRDVQRLIREKLYDTVSATV